MRTREEAYYVPILQVLSEMGGSGTVAEVLDRVGKKMKGVLKKPDYEPFSSDPKNLRWRNAAQWARNSMVNEGLLKKDSPRGVWGGSDKGKQCLNQGQSGKMREGISADDRGTCCSNCMALPMVGLIVESVRRVNHGTQH
jgi:hypothetical protein